jgi:hypothetical protein
MNDQQFMAALSYGIALMMVLLMQALGYMRRRSLVPGTRQLRIIPRRVAMIGIDTFIVGSFLSCALLVAYQFYFR